MQSPSGVRVEMAYRPLITGMMGKAAKYTGWRVCNGMDVLHEQAFGQSELWLGREAASSIMAQAMEAELARRRGPKIA